jgi:serine phosphatase RsbU (regulator of sigma subunit)
LEISGRSVAPNVVGGDCFDFIPMPGGEPDSVGVLVADASGHGMGAALLTGQTRAYLRAIALSSGDVGHVLDLTNQGLSHDIPTDHFVTAFLMRLENTARTLTYASAGHPPGHVLDSGGRTKAVLAGTGLPLGIDPSYTFPASPAVALEAGDLVVLITDGITEAASPAAGLFGMERTLRCVRRHRHHAPSVILTALFDAVMGFCNNKFIDDLTAVVVKVV